MQAIEINGREYDRKTAVYVRSLYARPVSADARGVVVRYSNGRQGLIPIAEFEIAAGAREAEPVAEAAPKAATTYVAFTLISRPGRPRAVNVPAGTDTLAHIVAMLGCQAEDVVL